MLDLSQLDTEGLIGRPSNQRHIHGRNVKPAPSTCAAGFSRVRHGRDPSDDRIHDRDRSSAEFPRGRPPATRRLMGRAAGEAQRHIRQAPHLMLPGLFLLVVTAALVVLGERARARVPE